ncbi:DUF3772 domain-containing protein [Luteimonas sp. MHLX1A]|uniref:DUF3772 domain-containing protein n=1 Tax=Alterluteimonas muca TaxID=2878684 RepID=UPI001E518CBE|nr:DUF3772 domain-containing protein [Luteimonas sp. MHLX1A]MCD9047480.1 DUF3772 domain-containing protein [Luteimonas sp. MHLX1A]
MSHPLAARIAMVLLWLLLMAPAFAQPVAEPTAPVPAAEAATATLDTADDELLALRERLGETTDTAGFVQLRDAAVALDVRVQDAVRTLEAELARVQGRLDELGPIPEDAAGEDAGIRERRAELAARVSVLDGAVKRGRLLGIDIRDVREEITATQGRQLGEQLSQRYGSPLTPRLWHAVAEDFPSDRQRVLAFLGLLERSVRDGIARFGLPVAVGVLALAIVLAWPLRRVLRRAGRRFALRHTPGDSRLRRTALAAWLVLSSMLCIGLAAWLASHLLRWGDPPVAVMEQLANAIVAAAVYGALVASLGNSLLMRASPEWRLPPLSEDMVGSLRPYPWLAGGLVFVDRVVEGVMVAINAHAALAATVTGAVALSYALLAISVRRRRLPLGPGGTDTVAVAAWVRALLGAIRLAVLALLVALVLGYFQFALLIGREVVWVGVVAMGLYLAWIGIDDLCGVLFGDGSRLGTATARATGIRPHRLRQAGLIVSAVTRALLVLVAIALVLAPLGTSFSGWRELVAAARAGLRIGEVVISPGGVLRAVLIFGGGWMAVQALHGWLVERFLPATDLDAASRNSVATVARYFGITVVLALGLAALGIGIQQIGLVVGALSVGIGFGLQAITQNFISGLILLAERPVKIGDWVRVGDFEGDVQRISVRATEIRVADRSTVIVPNSELITKPLRNMTLANPLGRVLLQFPVPLDTDVDRLRVILLETFAAHPAVLEDPAPSQTLDGIAATGISVTAVGFTDSPRTAGGVRSELLFTLLRRLREEGIRLAPMAQSIRVLRDDAGLFVQDDASPTGDEA